MADRYGSEVFITASIGIALYPDDGTDVDELLLNAEKAMRHTKSKGINNYSFYSKSMRSAVLDFLKIDKSFIDGVASDSRDQAIVRATIVMAHGLNMKTIWDTNCRVVRGYWCFQMENACK